MSLHASVLVRRTHHGIADDEGWHGERERERKNEKEEQKNKGEREKQRRSVASLPVTIDSRDIVEMDEAHGYGERTGKET